MDSRLEALLQRHLPELSGYPASLAREIQRALEEAGAVLADERELEEWVDGGVALARQSLRSWEASAEYFRVSPQVLRLVPYRSFVEWAGVGRELADESAALASAYFRAAPASLSRLSLPHVREWAAL